jgi:uncharacterized membrane protein
MDQLNAPMQRIYYVGSVSSLLALIALCIAWELLLAPLRPGGSWMALKVLPLLIPLRGVWKRDIYTLQWSSMLIMLYFIEGVVRAYSDKGSLSATLALLEVALVCVFFFSTILFLKPYKQAARELARQAIQKASTNESRERND